MGTIKDRENERKMGIRMCKCSVRRKTNEKKKKVDGKSIKYDREILKNSCIRCIRR